MNELHLFAGSGGGILGSMLLGHTCVCAVEIEPYPRKVLLQRQRDGILPKFPIWDDICTFDGTPWRRLVDIVCGGFPCTEISAAGSGEGITGEHSGLWKQMARVVDEVRPRFVFVENSPMLTARGLGVVLADLASLGYDARWCVLGGSSLGACTIRARLFLVASRNNSIRGGELWGNWKYQEGEDAWKIHPTANQPMPVRMVDDVANRVERLTAVGNGQIPIVAATAFLILTEGLI